MRKKEEEMIQISVYIPKKYRDLAQKAKINVSGVCSDALKTIIEVYVADKDLRSQEKETIIKLRTIRGEITRRGNAMIKANLQKKEHSVSRSSRMETFYQIFILNRGKLTPSSWIYWKKDLGLTKEELIDYATSEFNRRKQD